jgi:phosphate-selective porin OprO/OprP
MRTRALLRTGILLMLGNATPVCAQPAGPPIDFRFDDHPTVHFGDAATIEGFAKFQVDWRGMDHDSTVEQWDVHLFRAGVSGQVFKRIEYQIERELNDDTNAWRDVYVDVAASSALQVRAGKFKVPFSLDRLTSPMELDFVYRSLVGSHLTPGRDVGGLVHGRLFNRIVRYDAGLFQHGGDNVRDSERAQGDATGALRVTVSPWRDVRKSPWQALTFGGGLTLGQLPEGLNSLDGRTVFDHKLFPTFYVNGRRRRIGGDAEWRNGPFQLRGEVIDVRDDRRGEGTDDDDLPRLRSGGGYVSGTWIVTGEKKTDAVKPKHPLPRQGFGAVEIAGRVEWIGIGSSMGRELSAGPRAAVPADQRAHVVTLGVNWYLNRFVRLAADVIHETRYDGDVVVKTEQLPWAPVIRFQFGL